MIQTILTSFLLGAGLAMDACAVSMANGLNAPKMKFGKIALIAILFAFFQATMPLIGYFVGSAILTKIEWIIPWVALVLLGFIGGKMLYDGIKQKGEHEEESTEKPLKELTFKSLIVQAIATSIDALSVGFTISNYTIWEALVCAGIIAVVTFAICLAGVYIGKKFGTKLGNKAEILGGVILIIIGIAIFVKGMIGI